MEKDNHLNAVNLEGVIFIVDAAKDALIELSDFKNELHFSEMAYTDTHYRLQYQPDYRRMATERDVTEGRYITIKLPHLTALDPEGMAQKYGKEPADLLGKTDYEVMVDSAAVAQRMKGELPRVEILGQTFYADLRMQSLRPKDDFSTPGLLVKDLNSFLSPDGTHYRVPMDLESRKIYPVEWEKLTDIPRGVMLVDIPTIERLDPVGFAREHQINPRQFLRNHPPKQEQSAETVPWSETMVMEIILANRIRDAIKRTIGEDDRKEQQQRPRRRPKI